MQYIKIIESRCGALQGFLFLPLKREKKKKKPENFVWDIHIEVVSDIWMLQLHTIVTNIKLI